MKELEVEIVKQGSRRVKSFLGFNDGKEFLFEANKEAADFNLPVVGSKNTFTLTEAEIDGSVLVGANLDGGRNDDLEVIDGLNRELVFAFGDSSGDATGEAGRAGGDPVVVRVDFQAADKRQVRRSISLLKDFS